ncbi:MAG TPA: hypothetical protein VGY58_24225 [Gemmataceae bacterium]|nr:hypothetical protein [Gemmataceae bacterium]
MRVARKRGLILCLLFPLVAGCGATATVSGTVTYEGKPIELGKIRFLPIDDKSDLDPKGEVVGVDIIKGKYTAKEVPMGKKKVAIDAQQIAGQAAPAPRASKGDQPQTVEPLLPPEATRDLIVEINALNQNQNFDLKKPAPASDTEKKHSP